MIAEHERRHCGMQERDAANMVAIRRAIAKCAFARAKPSNPVRTLEGK